MNLEVAQQRLMKACKEKQLSFIITYSEADELFYAEASGQGLGEWTEVKRAGSMAEAMDWLTTRVLLVEYDNAG